jgi:putative membrane protein
MFKLKSFALGAALAASVAAGAIAAETRMTPEAFVNAAAQSDQYEIQAGRLIVTQSQDSRVRGFAQQMIDHHTQTSLALAEAASASRLPPPPKTMSGDQQRMLNALQSLNGPALDRTYMTQQVGAHVSALVTQQDYATSGSDPNLRKAAQSTVPMIQHHLETAKQLKNSMPAD